MVSEITEDNLIEEWKSTWGHVYDVKGDDFLEGAYLLLEEGRNKYPYRYASRDLDMIVVLMQSKLSQRVLATRCVTLFNKALAEDARLLRNSSTFGETAIYGFLAIMLGVNEYDDIVDTIKYEGRYNELVLARLDKIFEYREI